MRSATWEAMATVDGAVTPRLVDPIAALAKGGVGIIISGHAYIRPEGQAGPMQMSASRDELIPGLRQMAAAGHDHGAKMVLQVAHAGYFAAHNLTGTPPFAVSAAVKLDEAPRQELTPTDIHAVVHAFAAAAVGPRPPGSTVCRSTPPTATFSTSFSPRSSTGRRMHTAVPWQTDRVRVHLKTIMAVRQAVGATYPVLIKLTGRDFAEGGLELEESVEAAALMEQAGLDAVELSSGMTKFSQFESARTHITNQKKEAYNQEEARISGGG